MHVSFRGTRIGTPVLVNGPASILTLPTGPVLLERLFKLELRIDPNGRGSGSGDHNIEAGPIECSH